MNRNTPVAIFLAATAILTSNSLQAGVVHAEEKEQGMGGLKEWTTDQSIDEESTLDKEAKEALEKAKEEDICIPIGEGENCW